MAQSYSTLDVPWSHRQCAPVRALVTVLAAACSAAIGTVAHRMGAAQNVPYGLLLALLLVGLSAWCAHARDGGMGLGVHLIVSSAVAWAMAQYGPGGDVLVPGGFGIAVPYFSEHVGLLWLLGIVIVQIPMLLRSRRSVVRPADAAGQGAAGGAGASVGAAAAGDSHDFSDFSDFCESSGSADVSASPADGGPHDDSADDSGHTVDSRKADA